MARFTVTQVHDTEADDPVAAARDMAAKTYDCVNNVYRVEDDLGRLYEVDLNDNNPQAVPLPPF